MHFNISYSGQDLAYIWGKAVFSRPAGMQENVKKIGEIGMSEMSKNRTPPKDSAGSCSSLARPSKKGEFELELHTKTLDQRVILHRGDKALGYER
jgi:hypothetical protein